jgi:hypothetical protein
MNGERSALPDSKSPRCRLRTFGGQKGDTVEASGGDFNGDGIIDLALINHVAGWTSIPVALSTATGFSVQNRSIPGFAALATTPGTKVLVRSNGDFNGDGLEGLALVNQVAGWTTVPVAISSPTGFTIENRPAADFASRATNISTKPAFSGDFNGDGTTDLALVNRAAGWDSIALVLSTT